MVFPERDMGQRVAHSLVSANLLDYIELSPDISLVEIAAPARFVGKTLIQTDLRARYDINVVAIKRLEELLVPPQPDEVIRAEDILIAVGATAGIQRIALP